MRGSLFLIGCGNGRETLPEAALSALNNANIVAGGRRLLEQYAPAGIEQVIVGADAVKTVADLIAAAAEKNIVILASGDALYNGIGGTIRRLRPPADFRVIPGCTAFQYLYSALGMPWENVKLFSIHGKSRIPFSRILSSPEAVIYCDNKCPASLLAARLAEFHPESALREAVIGDSLGGPDERIITGSLSELSGKECSGLSMLLLKPHSSYPPLPLGLPDDYYEHENNMITHPEVRAVVLAKLRLTPGVMWDLGAGSGSVGLEAAGLIAGLSVHAVEQKENRFEQICANSAKLGLENYQSYHGKILELLDSLPDPDKIFIGGGGKDLAEIITGALARLLPGGTIVVTAVTLESHTVLNGLFDDLGWSAVSMNISRSQRIACSNMMRAENPITIYCYTKQGL